MLALFVVTSWTATFALSYTTWTLPFVFAMMISVILSIHLIIRVEDNLVGTKASYRHDNNQETE